MFWLLGFFYLVFTKSLIKDALKQVFMAKTDTETMEKIGFHKGSLATLSKEREEFMRILQIVEQLMQMHIKELKDLGVDLAAQVKEEAKKLKGNKAIEDVLKN